jgi:hypothetical protein
MTENNKGFPAEWENQQEYYFPTTEKAGKMKRFNGLL